MASLLSASFEAFFLDNEMHSANFRILGGIKVDDETLDLETIENAIVGEGHFLESIRPLPAWNGTMCISIWRILTRPSHGPKKAMPISGGQPTGG